MTLNLSVIVPVRNAETMIDACLSSLVRSEPYEIIVVDGLSTDRTIERAKRYPVKILSDQGEGVAMARTLGMRAAVKPWVALVDVDIEFPEGALAQLFDEFIQGQYTALQAGLHSVAGQGYWGQALVNHHQNGRSKNWPGVMATICDKQTLLEYDFDHRFRSGEDIELRWRLRQAGKRLGVSQQTIVSHRYEDTFDFALNQWLADGRGLARMIKKYGWNASYLLGLPLAGSVRGVFLSLFKRQLQWVPYYICYMLFNYGAMASEMGASFNQQLTTEPNKVGSKMVR